MKENSNKIFIGVDARGGDIKSYSTPLCANMDTRGTELRSRKGYTKMFRVALSDRIMGIFDYITKYNKNIQLPRVATVIEDDKQYSAVYSDGSNVYFVDAEGTRLRLRKYTNGAFTDYTLNGSYGGRSRIFELGGSLRIINKTGNTVSAITFNGSALSLTDSTTASGTLYGAFVSSIMSLAYIYGSSDINLSFDGATIATGPTLIGSPGAIQGFTEDATDIYLIQADGVVQTSNGGAWSSHATGVFVDPIFSNAVISGVDYMACVYAPGDSNYGIYTYDGTTLSRLDNRRIAYSATDGTSLYAIDNGVFIHGTTATNLELIAYVTPAVSTYGMQFAVLDGEAFAVGGDVTSKMGIMVVSV